MFDELRYWYVAVTHADAKGWTGIVGQPVGEAMV